MEDHHSNGNKPVPTAVSTSVSDEDEQFLLEEEEEQFEQENEKADRSTTLSEPNLHWTDLLRLQPWVLVKNGSWGGYFDNVPLAWRVGPWSMAAIVYLATVVYGTALSMIYYSSPSMSGGGGESPSSLLSAQQPTTQDSLHWYRDTELIRDLTEQYKLAYDTPVYWYNAVSGLWMLCVCYLIFTWASSFRAWGTYTVQSWTLLMVRHFLCAALSWGLNNNFSSTWLSSGSSNPEPASPLLQVDDDMTYRLTVLVELLRFPAACSQTLTFVLWNTVIGPFIYYSMKTAERRRNFVKFAFSFRLVQIHVFNIVFCVLHVYWASPRRLLQGVDLLLAVTSMLGFMLYYLFLLDRVGVHLYPIFSPRTGVRMVVVSWSLLLGAYIVTFMGWRALLCPIDGVVHGHKSILSAAAENDGFDSDFVERQVLASRISYGIL